MLMNRAHGREWKPTDHAGLERALFRYNETGGRSSFVRLKQGARVDTVIVVSSQKATPMVEAGRA